MVKPGGLLLPLGVPQRPSFCLQGHFCLGVKVTKGSHIKGHCSAVKEDKDSTFKCFIGLFFFTFSWLKALLPIVLSYLGMFTEHLF